MLLFDEVLSKKWRTEVVGDKTFRLPAGDAGVSFRTVSMYANICTRKAGWSLMTRIIDDRDKQLCMI